ncbi:hypothetical protein EYC80_007280 [Monilinia laxa]|uniref:Uncharacterized protein n=1 Tax=Monilinia laxa TaxID=61186 RepID=A0A5N6JVG0_MONLA|nr:hypothetical protein EYC80_007280 [Monilinia laxa]
MMDQAEAEYLSASTNGTPNPLPRRKSSLPFQPPVSQQSETTPSRFGPNGFIPSRRPPPIPKGTKSTPSNSQIRHLNTTNDMKNVETMRSNSRMTKISLADAKLRSKPLPPLGPMAPSAIPGVVEIGSTPEDFSSRLQLRPKKRFAKFFRKGRRV